MSTRAAGRLAWSLWALTLVFLGLGLLLGFLTSSAGIDVGIDATGTPILVALVTFSVVGAVIASRRARNPIGWIFCAGGLVLSGQLLASEYAAYTLLAKPGTLPGGVAAAWVKGFLEVPAIGLVAVFAPLLFPDGRLPSPRWRPVAWFAGCALVGLLAAAFRPGPLAEPLQSVRNPVGIEAAGFLDAVGGLAFVCLMASIVASVVSLIVRLRRAKGAERQQLKWVVYAALLVVLSLTAMSLTWIFPGTGLAFLETGFGVLALVAMVALPSAIGVAILKYRLYDIDRVISRTLVYGVLSVALAGLYFAIVLLLGLAFSPFTGGSELAIAGSTLAVAALFRPARRRIQAVVDRRFYRRKYDAQRTLEAFSARLREEIDLDALQAELTGVVRETMRPAHVSLWLRPQEGER